MDIKKLLNKIAKLESKLDQAETEIDQLNKLLIECGFQRGIETLKSTAQETILNKKKSSYSF
ncbi:MAG: hypothetical protein WCT85_01830 [Parachlamydiales bacterium]|jgi:hypothetical protein